MTQNKPTSTRKRVFRGSTIAHSHFSDNVFKTKLLLEVGLSGITTRLEEQNKLLEKFQAVKGVPGRLPKNYEPEIISKKVTDEGEIELTVDARSALLMKRAVERYRAKHTALRFHFYSILTVAIWGAFETYFVSLFEELYRKKPEILKSEEVITYKDILSRRENVLDLIIEKQLDKIGHFTLKEMLKYLSDKINFNFNIAKQKQLSDYYLIRNIIAHNSGLVQSGIESRLPETIIVKDKRVQITKAFLEKMLAAMEKHVQEIEKHVTTKFFKDGA